MNRFKVNAILASALVLACSSGSTMEVNAIENNSKNIDAIKVKDVLNDYSIDLLVSVDEETNPSVLREQLIQNIDRASQMHGDAEFGTYDGQYPIDAGNELIEVIKAATEVYNSGREDLVELRQMIALTESAMAKFLASKIDISQERAYFLQLIEEVTQVYNTATVGKEIGEYPQEAKDTLLKAIKVAEDVYNKPANTVNAQDIAAAKKTLDIAKENFFKKVITKVDVSELRHAITEAELFSNSIEVGDTPGKYPANLKEKLDELIQLAKGKIDSCSYKESQVMTERIKEAQKELEDSKITYEKINRTQLIEQLAIAEALRDSAIVGDKPGNCPEESLNNLNSAIYAASVVNLDRFASQSSIDDATSKLIIEINVFKDSIIKKEPIDMEEINNLLSEANSLVKSTSVGSGIGQVSNNALKSLKSKIAEVEDKLTSDSISQQEVNDIAKELKGAINIFKDEIIKVIDKEKLNEIINEAKNFLEKAIIGDGTGAYPQTAKDKLEDVIKRAEEVSLDEYANGDTVNGMEDTLRKALEEFKNSKKEDESKIILKEAINRAEQIIDDAEIGEEDGMYPEEDYNKFKSAINTAKSVLNTENGNYQHAAKELETAMAEFLQSENTQYKDYRALLQLKINECTEIYNTAPEGDGIGEYPSKAKQTFYKEIQSAKDVLSKNGKNSTEYLNALNKLEKAKDTFEESAISSEDMELYVEEIQTLLREISSKIKDADTSSEYGRVPENKKIALSVMFNKITAISQNAETLTDLKEGIKLAEYSISDFNDRSIHIDDQNIVQGRKLTGKVGSDNLDREKVNVVDKKEFIPKAGMAIDIKGTFAAIGITFTGIGGVLFKKKK